MRDSVSQSLPLDRSTDVDPDLVKRSSDVDRFLQMLREAMAETGWSIDSLAVHLQIDKAHVSRLFSGDKPWRIEHLVALPDDMEACFEKKRAEHFGLIVVAPVSGEQAVANLVSGLIGVLTSAVAGARQQLPARASSMAKAEMPCRVAKASLRRQA